ncbi:hypothetical protein Rpal_3810 [Rhodopseudomonas palustris TIE-1]|uniref:hypothetical protein n=1 Tax=Rhodopseudomonas palustris TaxID=1076 RepID=UPI000164B4A1|nr:hypothetical protein [Rhodopseudomonas palustris]ACF02309.1 hypothetical protein Rpal_3810 [Rhodopseudomonas palustris TIE-1]
MRDPTDDEKRRIAEIREVALRFWTPEPMNVGPRGRQHPDVVRAQTACRTAAWRDRNRKSAKPTEDERRRIEEIRNVATNFRTPEPKNTKPRGRQHPDVVRAQTALRTAAWRDRHRKFNKPTVDEFGRALVRAIAMAPDDVLDRLTRDDALIVGPALQTMVERGHDPSDVVALVKRIRRMRRRRRK